MMGYFFTEEKCQFHSHLICIEFTACYKIKYCLFYAVGSTSPDVSLGYIANLVNALLCKVYEHEIIYSCPMKMHHLQNDYIFLQIHRSYFAITFFVLFCTVAFPKVTDRLLNRENH